MGRGSGAGPAGARSLGGLALLAVVAAACGEPRSGFPLRAAEFERVAADWTHALGRLAATPVEFRIAVDAARLPDAGLALASLGITGRAEPAAGTGRAKVRVAVRDTTQPPRMPPLTAEVAGELRGSSLEFQARVSGPGDALELSLSGDHALEAGTGRAQLVLAPLRFRKGGLQPEALTPALRDLVESVEGVVEARGSLRWRGAELGGAVDVAVRNLDVVTEAATVERIDAVVRLSPPWPPQTPPGQTLAMARVDLGLELTEGLVTFRLRPDGVLELASASWRFAGGEVRTAGPYDPAAAERSLVLEVSGVSLESLLEIATLDGLSGEGTVSGTLPVTLGPEGVRVSGGRLSAEPGGWIRYRPGASVAALEGSTPGFELLLPALRNFRYEKLALALDGELTGEVTLALSLAGANPEFRDGHPVELNLNVEARLADLLGATDLVYEMPGRVEEQLERFRRAPPPPSPSGPTGPETPESR